jgi:phospholipid-transporting ATPase
MADDHGSSRHMSASQKELGDEDAWVVRAGDAERTNERLEFAGNAVRTAKYSPLTFLPRNLFEQFHRLAYVYFLVIAVLNQLPQLAVFGRGASVMPLAIVLTVTAVKDAYEDWRRHRSDRAENGRLAAVLSSPGQGGPPQFLPTEWKHVRVGDVVRVVADESLPADMVLLATSEPTGVAYVQTLNLDGESNLKPRYAKQETLCMPPDQLAGAVVRCERPNRNIYGFKANLELEEDSNRRVPLGPSNIVLRGCELKNTAWAVGVVVYAGRETKAMLNNAGAPKKRSRLETHMNRETLFLSAILVVLCSIMAALSGVWLHTHEEELELAQFFHKKDYLSKEKNGNYNYYGIAAQIVFIFLMAVIVFQIMIPISLYISMELVRLGQAYFMIRDTRLYDESSNTRFQCRALNINEDLGQIKCIFSDKTGTLTQNKMEFRCASIDGVDYSDVTRQQPVGSVLPPLSQSILLLRREVWGLIAFGLQQRVIGLGRQRYR